jgi:hypothetical protein
MSKQAAILDQDDLRHKRPWDLTGEEVLHLMQAFTRDKCTITEADALTLCHWAQAQKRGAYVLHLVLAGHLRVEVEGTAVKVGLPRPDERPRPPGRGDETGVYWPAMD